MKNRVGISASIRQHVGETIGGGGVETCYEQTELGGGDQVKWSEGGGGITRARTRR